jgi:Leucine-rich repeat (LRR) protein
MDGAKNMFADLPRLSSLDISNFQVFEFPPGMLSVTTLRHLSLKNARLVKVPPEIKTLVNLEVLDLKGNTGITALESDVLRNLAKLRVL